MDEGGLPLVQPVACDTFFGRPSRSRTLVPLTESLAKETNELLKES